MGPHSHCCGGPPVDLRRHGHPRVQRPLRVLARQQHLAQRHWYGAQ
eukprot:jgi/Astpho2/1005/gw1.00016.302.1_t